MTDRPIIFSGPMVRALLEGSKTQTRRLISTKGHANLFDGSWTDEYVLDPGNADWRACHARFAVGDRLYVRENFTIVPASAYRCSEGVQFTVDPSDREVAAIYSAGWDRSIPKWRPSIHMPRWASRLTLTVTEVRVQRLQDISEADALAEGAREFPAEGPYRGPDATYWTMADPESPLPVKRLDPVSAFKAFFEELHGIKIWAENPWTVAVSFAVAKQNIDEQPKAPS